MSSRRGWGCRGGYGFGFRRFISPKNELAALEDEEKMLEEELAAIKEEIAALKNQQKQKKRQKKCIPLKALTREYFIQLTKKSPMP
jgi:hypothetical protein